ncbi:MAG: response regulator [Sedimentisphaerales bacterium]|jgi:DNA-binding response OmpR family regulator
MESKKILIIDDDRVSLLSISAKLRANGFRTVAAADAIMATTIAKQENPDLIILDINLPGGDGITVMKHMSSINTLSLTPIIIITGTESESLKKRALESGAVAFFQKPFNLNDLMETVQKILGIAVTSEADSKPQ